jgi:hypothetical protein
MHPIFVYVNPKNYMSDGITGDDGDEDELEAGVLRYLDVPNDTIAQLVRRPGSFILFLSSEETQKTLLRLKTVRTNPNLGVRAMYNVSERRSKVNVEPGLSQKALTAHSANYVARARQSVTTFTTNNETTSTTPSRTTSATATTDTPTRNVNSFNDEEQITNLVKKVMEETMHTFVGKQDDRIRQISQHQKAATKEHEAKMIRFERMLMLMASQNQQNRIEDKPQHDAVVNFDSMNITTPIAKGDPKASMPSETKSSSSDGDSVSSEESELETENLESRKHTPAYSSSSQATVPKTTQSSDDESEHELSPQDNTPKRKTKKRQSQRNVKQKSNPQHPITTYLSSNDAPQADTENKDGDGSDTSQSSSPQ